MGWLIAGFVILALLANGGVDDRIAGPIIITAAVFLFATWRQHRKRKRRERKMWGEGDKPRRHGR